MTNKFTVKLIIYNIVMGNFFVKKIDDLCNLIFRNRFNFDPEAFIHVVAEIKAIF